MSVADHPRTSGLRQRGGIAVVNVGADVSRQVLADSAATVDHDLAERIRNAPRWRREYVDLFGEVTRHSARSRRASLEMAQAGLRSMSDAIVFTRGGSVVSLAEALVGCPPTAGIETRAFQDRSARLAELEVPYRGRLLRQASLLAQLNRWLSDGIVEPSFALAIERVVAHPEWLSLPGRRVVVTGACSNSSPVLPLLTWGADVLAIDEPHAPGWMRMTEAARRSPGLLRIPMSTGGGPGLHATSQLPEVRTWIARNAGEGLVLGIYGCADGVEHVFLSAAMDALAAHVLQNVPDTSLAYLATTNDAFVIDESVADSARNVLAPVGRLLTAGRGCATTRRPQAPGRSSVVANGLLRHHGPHYALAKRLERWRGLTAMATGHTVSVNVAPPTLDPLAARRGMPRVAARGVRTFGVELFAADTARVLMAALLVHDLHQPAPAPTLTPEAIFAEQAAHGGTWRAGFDVRSVMSVVTTVGMATRARGHLLVR